MIKGKKKNFIHYLSTHGKRKKHIIIGIYHPEFLSEVRNTYAKPGYLKGLLYITEEKACKIICCKQNSNTKYLVVPHPELIDSLRKLQSVTNIQIVAAMGIKVKGIVSRKSMRSPATDVTAGMIESLTTRLKEHRGDLIPSELIQCRGWVERFPGLCLFIVSKNTEEE